VESQRLVQVVAGALAVLCIVIVILRRKGKNRS
jgi:hypothetical protein